MVAVKGKGEAATNGNQGLEKKGCDTGIFPYGSRHIQDRQPTPVSGQCGSHLWPQAKLCHSGSACATSKKEVSVKHLLQGLPPISLHPDLSAFMCLLTVSTLPDTLEFKVPTHEERL